MAYSYGGYETAILRQVYISVIAWATGDAADMIQLRCSRSGAWIAVTSLDLKKYLTKHPFAEEVEDKETMYGGCKKAD